MQCTPDRNAGFSTATDPGRLYLPVVQSLTFHYSGVNVEAQLAQPASLLHWKRGMLEVRRRHPVFGIGEYVPVDCDEEAILAYLRVSEDETVLCINNFAPAPRSGTLQIPELPGAELRDIVGGAKFPTINKDGSLKITLGGRGFYWLIAG